MVRGVVIIVAVVNTIMVLHTSAIVSLIDLTATAVRAINITVIRAVSNTNKIYIYVSSYTNTKF